MTEQARLALEPKNLHTIWGEIHAKRFRVRNTETLEDYLITGIKHWMQGMPHYCEAVKCDGMMFERFSFDAWTKHWALLSTKEELEFLKGLQDQQAAFKAKLPYKRLASP